MSTITDSMPDTTSATSTTPLLLTQDTDGGNAYSKRLSCSRAIAASANTLNTVMSGAAFGAALVAAGVYEPAIIVGQLELKNWHMMQAFLTATASSAAFIVLVEKLGYEAQSPRRPTTVGLFARHDANIVGGSLLGLGMAIGGACPGTLLAQAGVGITSGYYAVAGGVAGGIAWVRLFRGIVNPHHPPTPSQTVAPPPGTATAAAASQPTPEKHHPRLTVQDCIPCRRGIVLAAFEALCVASVAAIIVFLPSTRGRAVAPVAGGALIGLAQLWSLLARRALLGASSAYEEVATAALWPVGGARPKSVKNAVFAAGMVVGAWGVKTALPRLLHDGVAPEVGAVKPLMAAAGGFLVVLGSRIAGGCTSGHGISGMAMFSLSSYVTIGAALGTGFLVRGVLMPAVGWV